MATTSTLTEEEDVESHIAEIAEALKSPSLERFDDHPEPEPELPTSTTASLNEKQTAALEQLRQRITKWTNPLSDEERRWLDDMCLLRYLRARNYQVERSEKMLHETLQWRASYKPHNISANDVSSQITQGHMYLGTFDLEGRPVLYLRVFTKKNPHNREQRLQYMIYSIERAIRHMPIGVEKMVWLVDCKDYSYKYNADAKFGLELLNILQNHYPERLGLLVIFDAPLVFKTFWNMVYPFVDPITKKKISFIERTSDYPTKLAQYFDLSKLEKTFGGSVEQSYDSVAYSKAEVEFEAQLLKRKDPK